MALQLIAQRPIVKFIAYADRFIVVNAAPTALFDCVDLFSKSGKTVNALLNNVRVNRVALANDCYTDSSYRLRCNKGVTFSLCCKRKVQIGVVALVGIVYYVAKKK